MNGNICKFLPKFENYNFFNIINLVYETACIPEEELKIHATYRMHLVTEGKGAFCTEAGERPLETGDLFITPPALPFSVEDRGDLSYVYISYLGVRAGILAEDYRLDKQGSIFHGYDYLIPLWRSAFEKERENANVCCEAIVLYSFSEIGDRLFAKSHSENPDSAAKRIKDLIDERFTESGLDLERIAQALSYHPKYVSATFKKEFQIGIGEYIRTLRIQHACTLMEQGITSLKNIAALCGYEDSLYFSSVFKRQMGVSPKEHIQSLQKK